MILFEKRKTWLDQLLGSWIDKTKQH